jgi:ribosomal-protein-alanine N-acetyltransferase
MTEIKTYRLTLKPLQVEHAEGLFPVWSDTDVVRFTYMRLVKDVKGCEQTIRNMLESGRRREDAGPYTVFSGDTVIGLVGAVRTSWESGEHELYYHLGKPHWGNGYATEAARAVIGHVFSTPLVHRISAEVVTANARSIRVLEKCPMKLEGRQRGKFFKDGIYRDLFLYSLLRYEWEQMAPAISSRGNSITPPG